MKRFILLFDIPENMSTLKVRINRMLHNKGVEMLQQSVWKSRDIGILSEIADKIKRHNGKAMVLEEKVVVPYFSF